MQEQWIRRLLIVIQWTVLRSVSYFRGFLGGNYLRQSRSSASDVVTPKRNVLQQWIFRDLQSTLRCCPQRVAAALTISGRRCGTRRGYDRKLWIHRSGKVLNSQTLFPARPVFKVETAKSHVVLSQGCRVGAAGLVTPPHTELSPLLCWEQRCHGVTMFSWFPRLVTAHGQLRQFLAALFLCSGGWSLLSSLAECWPPGVQHGWKIQWRAASCSEVHVWGRKVCPRVLRFTPYLPVFSSCRRSLWKFHLLSQDRSVVWALAIQTWQTSV